MCDGAHVPVEVTGGEGWVEQEAVSAAICSFLNLCQALTAVPV